LANYCFDALRYTRRVVVLTFHREYVTLNKAAALFLILAFFDAVPALTQEPHLETGKVPRGWVGAPSSKDNPDLWQCAGYGGSWVVREHQGAAAITAFGLVQQNKISLPPEAKLSKEMIGRRSLLRTSDGWLIGFDAGEFGGGLWWFSLDGRDTKKLLSENVHAIHQTPEGIFVLAGLAHLGEDNGEIDQVIDTPDKISVRFVANLGGSPEASTVQQDGQIVVATMRSVLLVDHTSKIHELYKSGERLVYPTSVVVDGQGNIFVAMRFFVLQLVPHNDSYDSQWLMPTRCRSVKLVKYECACTGTN
jgi:hypothetical protein